MYYYFYLHKRSKHTFQCGPIYKRKEKKTIERENRKNECESSDAESESAVQNVLKKYENISKGVTNDLFFLFFLF